MRLEDIKDYFKLRQMAANPWEIMRFRKSHKRGQVLEVRMLDGHRIYIRGGWEERHTFHRVYLRDEYRLVKSHHDGWDCVIDLGGNVGFFACRAATLSRKVVCYEPVPENFAQLKKNIEGWPNIFPVCEAVAGKAGTLRLYRPRYHRWASRYSMYHDANPNTSKEFDEVPAITLDQLFERHRISSCDLLKMDVEGAEFDILWATSDRTFSRIRRIYGEYHHVHSNDSHRNIDALSSFLHSKGFDVEIVTKRKKVNYGLFFAIQAGVNLI